ncbi:MAG: hypothetical protein E7591_07200 [Ruminococcaceae bacterium]|nr:hypothetical protein [Oscillospiraceae bacterium]
MKHFKIPLSLTLAVIMLVSCLSLNIFAGNVETEDKCGDSLTWRFSPANGVLTILGEGKMYDFAHISSNSSTAPWKNYRFEIKKIILGSGITSIGKFAFAECTALESISFPLSVKSIGVCAFADCQSLKSIIIPDNITSIGSQAFIYCTSLERAVLGNGLTTVEYGTFYECTSLKDVTFGKGLTSIVSEAFYNCTAYEDIVLPEQYVELSYESFMGTAYYENEENWYNGGLYIGEYFLYGNKTTNGTFVIRPGTKYVASYSLYDLSPGSIYYPRTIEKINEPVVYVYHFGASHVPYDSPYVLGFSGSVVSGGTRRLCPTEGKSGDVYYRFDETGTILTFYGNGATKDYELIYPDGQLRLNTPWVYISSYIDEVVIEEGVTTIGSCCFPYVKKATLADSVTHINSEALRGSFATLNLPKNLEYICPTNYLYIPNLEEITISEDSPNFAAKDGVLYSKDMKTLIKYPCAKKDEHFAVPDTVTALDPNAFNDLQNLKTLYIPESVTKVDNISTKSGVTIQCKLNSAALDYAKAKNIPYEIICDHSFTNYTEHSATCTEDACKTALCDLGCGAVDKVVYEGTAKGHDFAAYVNDNNASCTENSTSTAVCGNGCGTKDTVVNEGTAWGHSFINYIFNKDTTCTENGTSTAECENGCGATDTRIDENTAYGHSFTDYTVVIPADCTNDEIRESFCDRGCGTKDVRTIEGTALGHSFTNYVDNGNAGCTVNATKTALCDVCGASDTVEIENSALGHSFTEYKTVTEASCTEKGIKEALCDRGCGEKDVKSEEAKGHTPGEWIISEDGGEKIRECTECGLILQREAIIPEPTPVPFPDVESDAWYYDGVVYCVKMGYIMGNDKGEFNPSGKLTREQFVVILARASGEDIGEYKESPFTDVAPDSWYGAEVIWANEKGYVNGIGNGKFGVGHSMTRETVAVMLFRYSNDEGIYTDGLNAYSDKQSISSWAAAAAGWAVKNGILGSTSTDALVFSPKMTLSRAQAAKIFTSYDKIK